MGVSDARQYLLERVDDAAVVQAAKDLFDTYGVHFDSALRDEVVPRVDALNLPSYTAASCHG
jgi:dipeptidyl-peptidase-3